MKTKKHLLNGYKGTAVLLATLAGLFSTATNSFGVSATWNGTTDGVWATSTNWSASPVPGPGDTATFNNAGNANTTLDLGPVPGISLLRITFDTASAAAYTIGSGGAGNQTLTLLTGGTTQLTASTGNNQTIDANILLGANATTSTYIFTNASPTRTLTLTGNVTGNTGGTGAAKELTVNGAGNTTISGAISNGGATNLALVKSGPGTLTLSGNNSYTGTTRIGAQGGGSDGSLFLSGSGRLGTGALTLWEGTLNLNNTTQTINGLSVGGGSAASSATVLIGSGILNLGGNIEFSGSNNHAGSVISGTGGGVINLWGTRAFNVGDSNIASDDLTISAIIANGDATARGITKGGGGVLTLTAANTFNGTTTISAGTLKLDFAAANAPTSDILYNGVTAGALSIAAGTTAFHTLLVQGKSDTTNSQAFGNLSQTGGSGLASITVNSGSNGTMNLSLGTIARTAGTTIAFTGPASGNITTTQAAGRIAGATYTSGSGVTTWAGVTTGMLAAFTGDTLYTGGDITSNGTANLFINSTTNGTVTQGAGNTTLATLSMLDAADRTVAVGTGNALLFSGPAGGVQSSGAAGNLTIGTLGNAGSITAGTTGAHEFIITNGAASSLLTINSVITNNSGGSQPLILTGPGRTVFTGNNTYTGNTILNAGILEIQNNNALGTGAGATFIATGATLGLSGNITTAEAIAAINGNGAGNGGALRNISGNNTFSGTITPGSASRINSDAGTLTITGNFINSSGHGLIFGGSGNTTLSTPISSSAGALVKDGSGTLTLLTAGVVNTSGAVTVNDGTLRYAANDAMGTGAVTVNGGTFDLSTFSDTVGAVTLSAGSIIGSGTLTGASYALNDSGTISANLGSSNASLGKNGNGTATLAGTSAYTGVTTINAGTLNITGNLTGGTAITLASPFNGIGGTGSLIQGASSVISGATSITTAGNMALVTSNVLAGNNTYTGVTNIIAGVWRLLHSNALGSTANGTSASSLELAGDISIGAEALTLFGGGFNNAGALRNISGNNSWAGDISPGGGATRINSDAGTLTLTGNILGGGHSSSIILGGAGNIAISGNIGLPSSGSRTLTKDGTGIATLTGTNSYGHATTVSDGILTFGQISARAPATTVTAAAAGTIGLGVGGAGYYSSANVTSLFNTNTLTGFVLNAASGVAIDTTNAGGSFEQSTALTAARSLTKLGTGTLILSGTNTYNGTTTIASGGTLQIGNGTDSGSINSTSAITNDGALVYNVGAGNRTLGAVSGIGSLTQNSAGGALTLSGTNTYIGSTTVAAGTLFVNGSLAAASAVSVNSGGTLGGNGTIGGSVTVNSGGTLAPGTSPGVLTVDTLLLNSGSTTRIEINGVTRGTLYDGINITATLGTILTYGGNLTFSFGNVAPLADSSTLDIFNFSGTIGGSFANVVSTGFYAGTWANDSGSWWFNDGAQLLTFNQTTGDLVVVPEPSTWAFLVGGLAALVIFRRRRRKV